MIKDENKYISQRILNEFDGLVERVLEEYLFELVALIRVVFNKLYDKWLYDVQVIASLKLYKGIVLEMKTGEGKTYVIAATAILYSIRAYFLNLCFKRAIACCNAIPGKPVNFTLSKSEDQTYYFQVQIVTANDYLARRDYSELSSLYNFFDFSSYYIQEVGGPIPKQQYFKFEVLYCTCRNLCHLSLIDMLRKDKDDPFLSSVNYVAILDEIDQILLDEARTPHIISQEKTQETYKIDSIYQAKHVAQKLLNIPYIFDHDNGLSLSLLGKWFYLTKINDFFTAYSKHSDGISREESFSELKNAWERSYDFQLKELLLSSKEIHDFLDFLFDQYQDFFIYVIPFLLRAISIKEDVLQHGEHQPILIDSIISDLGNLDRDEFKKMVVNVAVNISIELSNNSLNATDNTFLELIYFIFFPEKYDAKEGEEYLELFVEYINSFLRQFSLDSEPLTKTIYHLINYDLPLISDFFETNVVLDAAELNLKQSYEKCFRFIDCRSEHFDLFPDLNELLQNEEKLIKYLGKKVHTSGELKQESLINLVIIFMRIVYTSYSYPLHFYINEIIENRELNTNAITNKLFKSIADDLRKYSQYGCFDESVHKVLSVWRKNLNAVFSNDLPEELAAFLDEAKDSLVESSDDEQIEMVDQILEDYKTRNKSDDYSYILFVAEIFGRLTSFFIKMIRKKDSDTVLLRRIQNINITCLLDYCQSAFGKNVFEEFERHANKVPVKDEELEMYYEDVLIEYILNPYQRIKESQTKYTQNQLRTLAKSLADRMDDKKFSKAFRRYYYYFLPPFHTEIGTEQILKHRKLHPAARVICQYHTTMLKNMMFDKGLDHIDFYAIVQKCFDALLFYKKDEDYIVSSIDEGLHPDKIKHDPYLNENETREVVIFDGITGRALISNRWSQHLHSSIEAKENLLVRGELDSIVQVTPQSYFLKYRHLNGLSGTTIIAKDEFWLKYKKSVEEIPTNEEVNRCFLEDYYGFDSEGTMKEMLFDALGYHFQYGGSNLIILETVEQSVRFESELKILWKKIKTYTKEVIDNTSAVTLAELKKLINSDLSNKYQSRGINSLVSKIWNGYFGVDHDEASFVGWIELYRSQDNEDSVIDLFEHQKNIETQPLSQYNATTMDPGFLNTCRISIITSVLDSDGIIPITILKLDGTPSDLSKESEIIKLAGEMGTTLIATRVAGRGTDIKLKPYMSEQDSKTLRQNPGLNILVYNHQDSRRHDQQIEGRCGRQGDPGRVRYYNTWKSSYMQRVLDAYLQEVISDSENFFQNARFLSIVENLQEDGEEMELFADLDKGTQIIQIQYEEVTKHQRNYEKEMGQIVLEAQKKINDKTDFYGKWFLPPYRDETQDILTNIEQLKDREIKTYMRILGDAVHKAENFKFDFCNNHANAISNFIFILTESGYALDKIKKVVTSLLIGIHVVENDWAISHDGVTLNDPSAVDAFFKEIEHVVEDIHRKTHSIYDSASKLNVDDVFTTGEKLLRRLLEKVPKERDRIDKSVNKFFDGQLIRVESQDSYFKKLTRNILNRPTFRQYFFHIMDSIYVFSRSESFELYADFIESFKTHFQFSPFANPSLKVKFFRFRSEILCEMLTCWITIRVFASCKLLLALSNESDEVKFLNLLKYLDSLNIKLVKYPNLVNHDQITESIIRYFKIPLNAESLEEVVNFEL